MEKQMTLEQANALLEETIHQLENEALPLDESVALYARACELMAFCLRELDSCKEKINAANERLAQLTGEDRYE